MLKSPRFQYDLEKIKQGCCEILLNSYFYSLRNKRVVVTPTKQSPRTGQSRWIYINNKPNNPLIVQIHN